MQEASILEGDFFLRNPGLHHVQNFRLKKKIRKRVYHIKALPRRCSYCKDVHNKKKLSGGEESLINMGI